MAQESAVQSNAFHTEGQACLLPKEALTVEIVWS